LGKTTLNIEGEDFNLEFSRPQTIIGMTKNGREFKLEIQEIFSKGYRFKLSESSSQSYWWQTPTEPLFVCNLCGRIHQRGYANPYGERMEKAHLCFSCSLWSIFSEGENSVVIDGHRYSIGSEGASYPGFGGQKFDIEFFDGRRITTKNLWHQGEVPIYFKDQIPDTARFIQEKNNV
jgi:hypothetical protein